MKKTIVLLCLLMSMVSYGKVIVIPRGTSLMLKTTDTIDGSQHNAGHKFSGILEGDIIIDNQVVIKSGSRIYGEVIESVQSGRLVGTSKLSIKLTQIMIENKLVSFAGSKIEYLGEEGSGRNTLKKTAGAAAIGGLIGGSDGAKTGAAVGVGLSILTKGGSIRIPSGTFLDFTFEQDTVI